jgi:aminoglycoside phosphotransferase family enzyme/predicted kinase
VSEQLTPGFEHVVVMRRLPDGRDALSLLAQGGLTAELIDAIAARIARFHADHGLGAPAPFAPDDWCARATEPMRANLAGLREAARAGVIAGSEVEALAAETAAASAAHATPLERRRREGRAVDAHGDLHLQHIWLEPVGEGIRISLIDCIEFSDALRQIDAASELAFLAMDLDYRGAPQLGERFLRKVAALRDDFGLYDVVDWFAAYRAAVRAKVAALAAQDAAIEAAQRARAAESVAKHVALARALLRPSAVAPLFVVCGSVGTGKSTVAEHVADLGEGVVISSDRTRKALAGLAPESRAHAHAGAALYADAATERVYAALLERAEPVLRSGRAAVLDATFAQAAQRDAARAFAARLGARAVLVEVTCAEDVARARVAQRAARGADPSDAGPELVAPSRARFEPPREWPPADALAIATDVLSPEDVVSALRVLTANR